MFHKKIRLRLNNAHFLDNLSWKSTFIKSTIRQRIKLSISSFCCLEMFSEFKTISTAFLDVHQNAILSESFEGNRSRAIGNRCNHLLFFFFGGGGVCFQGLYCIPRELAIIPIIPITKACSYRRDSQRF